MVVHPLALPPAVLGSLAARQLSLATLPVPLYLKHCGGCCGANTLMRMIAEKEADPRQSSHSRRRSCVACVLRDDEGKGESRHGWMMSMIRPCLATDFYCLSTGYGYERLWLAGAYLLAQCALVTHFITRSILAICPFPIQVASSPLYHVHVPPHIPAIPACSTCSAIHDTSVLGVLLSSPPLSSHLPECVLSRPTC